MIPAMNPVFGDLHDGGAIAEIFSERAFIDRCLRFERYLAEAQAELGMIPEDAAEEIQRAARIENIDLDALRKKTRTVGLPIVGLVDQVVRLCRADLGQHVHYGATTQDTMDCALALQMREALVLVDTALNRISAALDDLAVANRHAIQAGRTNQQHALPITFGFKAAVWNAGVRRQIDRLAQIRQRAATGQLGGAVGTLASFSGTGHELRRRLMRKLALSEPGIAWHSMRDGPVECVMLLAQIAATLGKIGRDLLMLSSTEVGEIAFSAERGASSTMPQKSNPVAASSVVALARMVFHASPMVLDASLVENERSLDAWYVELHAVPLCFSLTGALLGQTLNMLDELRVDTRKMASNALITGGAITSETAQMVLAKHIGLNRAHALVSKACSKARADGTSVVEELIGLDTGVDEETLRSSLDVSGHMEFGLREVEASRRQFLW